MKYISQLDYPDMPYITRTSLEGEAREKGLHTTIKTSGCGLCSAVMVADRLLVNYDFGLEAATGRITWVCSATMDTILL